MDKATSETISRTNSDSHVVRLEVDSEAIKDMEQLRSIMRAPNLTTAIYNAVLLIKTLYDYQSQGYEFRLVKNNDVRRFRLPTS